MLEARLIHVPISRLSPIPHGVRKTNGVSIENLAASIAAEGLLQNLNVVPDTDSALSGAEEFQNYQVIAGSRRLKALKHLVDTQVLPADYEVPCRVIAPANALSASLAENAIREPMHAGDEFIAFRDMVDAGLSIEDVAQRFGVTPLVVQRRLKLANVSPKLFELFLQDELSLDQMMALAIVDDHKQQEKAWFKVEHEWQRRPHELRVRLTHKEISLKRDPVARFVGRAAYAAAGGVVHEDLFSNDGEGYVADVDLLQRLAAQKLEAVAEQVRHEAWAWVDVRTKLDYSELNAFTRAEPLSHRKPDDAEKKRIKALTAERVDIEKRLRQMQDDDVEDTTGEGDRLEERAGAIGDELVAMESARAKWDPKVLAQAGAIVTIQEDRLLVHRGLVKGKIKLPKDKKLAGKSSAKGSAAAAAEEPPAGHSQALVGELTTAVSFALTAALIANPGCALIALTHALALDTFYDEPTYDHPVRISTKIGNKLQMPQLQDGGPEVAGNPDIARMASEQSALDALLPDEPEQLLGWLFGEGNPHMVRLLAFCVATSINTMTTREDNPCGVAVCELIGLDMRTRWTPKAANYLSRVSAAQIRAALKEHGVHDDLLATTQGMRKADLVAFAEPLLVNWVPALMRFDHGTAHEGA
jgi:ParB family chromosome partitioning protein